MGKLPRPIRDAHGFIFIKYIGVLPYKDKEDKETLFALGQIYCKGVQSGVLANPTESFYTRRGTPSEIEIKAQVILIGHAHRNTRNCPKDIDTLMTSIARKQGKNVFFLTRAEIDNLLEKSTIEFFGELQKK